MPKLIQWPKKITFSRGPADAKETEKDVLVEVPQIPEDLALNEFTNELVTMCGGEQDAKEWVNNQIANGAIGAGRSYFNASANKKDTTTVAEALKESLVKIRDYTPSGGRAGEGATAKAKKFDALAEASAKLKAGELAPEEFEKILAATLGL